MTAPVLRADRPAARRALRTARRALGAGERHRAGLALCRHVAGTALFRGARHMAFYLPFDGELDVEPLMRRALSRGKHVYLPVLGAALGRGMGFARYADGTPLIANRFGIFEPAATRVWDTRRLDVVFTPLVGFDPDGHRLGMGGGYYDDCFAFLRHRLAWHRPKLVGVGYELQRLPAIEPCPWDVRLWCIATEQGIYRPAHH